MKEGKKTPVSVQVVDANGKVVSLKDYAGKTVILYFYPKDDTPGCTLEALAFEEYLPKFKKLGVVVVGVSKDSCASHQKFAKKYKLSFALWSDPEQKLIDAFGVWQKKKFMGREYMGIVRSTYVIDAKGMVIKAYESVSAKGHAEEVYAFILSLSKDSKGTKGKKS